VKRNLAPHVATAEGIAEHTWRITTAVRAFVLAFATGQVISAGMLDTSGADLELLLVLCAACCIAELHPRLRDARPMAYVEGSVTATLVVAAFPDAQPFLVCLSVPAVVAGIRYGVRTTLLTVVATSALVGSALLLPSVDHLPPGAWGWLVLGLGGGLLGAVQNRSARRAAAAQASYTSAHRLLGQLHSLVQRRAMDLDVTSLAGALRERVERMTDADSCTVWVRLTTQDIELLSGGGAGHEDEELAGRCLGSGTAWSHAGVSVVPLRVDDHVFGAVAARSDGRRELPLQAFQALVDEHAVRLDTALLVDGIRASATDAERLRLAREIHDGVAQRVVSLGYLADELLDLATDPVVARAAEELRTEVTRVVVDLRQDLHAAGVSEALSEYVHQLSRRSDLRIHLLLDERGNRLPARVETEVIRIAQEAIANVAQHADAVNLWVRFCTDDEGLRLTVEDDGVGAAQLRPGHYGMHTMQERAEHIGAELYIGPRPDGGTMVSLRSGAAGTSREDTSHDEPRLAHR
jgi:signal transduction histidine kinase